VKAPYRRAYAYRSGIRLAQILLDRGRQR
jgi:hypothetical protein